MTYQPADCCYSEVALLQIRLLV